MASSLLIGLYYFHAISGVFDGVKGVYHGLIFGVILHCLLLAHRLLLSAASDTHFYSGILQIWRYGRFESNNSIYSPVNLLDTVCAEYAISAVT